MARKKLEYSDIYPFHIYGKSNSGEWFHIPIDQCWDIFTYFLKYVCEKYNLKVHAFVLMNNHYHMIASTPENNLPVIMNRLLTEVSKAINDAAGKSNHVFGGQYRATIIKNGQHYFQALRYVYQNPIAAGLISKVENYPYSTASTVIGKISLPFPLEKNEMFNDYIYEDPFKFLEQMNDVYTKEQRDLIRKAMQRREYKLNRRLNKKLFDTVGR